MLDRDVVIGSVVGGYKRLKEEGPHHELLRFMTLYPLSDQPTWEMASRGDLFRRFGNGADSKPFVPTEVMANYSAALQHAIAGIVESRLERDINTVGVDVRAALEYMAAPAEVPTAVAKTQAL